MAGSIEMRPSSVMANPEVISGRPSWEIWATPGWSVAAIMHAHPRRGPEHRDRRGGATDGWSPASVITAPPYEWPTSTTAGAWIPSSTAPTLAASAMQVTERAGVVAVAGKVDGHGVHVTGLESDP